MYFNHNYSAGLSFLDLNLNSRAKSIFHALDIRANSEGICWPSLPRIKKDTSLSLATVKRAISDLIGEGLIERITRLGYSTKYRIIDPLTFLMRQGLDWRTPGSNTEKDPAHSEPQNKKHFKGIEQQTDPAVSSESPPPKPDPETQALIDKLLAMQLPRELSLKLLSDNPRLVKDWVQAIEEGLVAATNPAGYLRRAVEQRWRPPVSLYQARQDQQRRAAKLEAQFQTREEMTQRENRDREEVVAEWKKLRAQVGV